MCALHVLHVLHISNLGIPRFPQKSCFLKFLERDRLEYLEHQAPKMQFLWYTVKANIPLNWRKFCWSKKNFFNVNKFIFLDQRKYFTSYLEYNRGCYLQISGYVIPSIIYRFNTKPGIKSTFYGRTSIIN